MHQTRDRAVAAEELAKKIENYDSQVTWPADPGNQILFMGVGRCISHREAVVGLRGGATSFQQEVENLLTRYIDHPEQFAGLLDVPMPPLPRL